MASALYPQTFLIFKISDEILAPRYGYPLKLRIPIKLGFKNPKWITGIFVTTASREDFGKIAYTIGSRECHYSIVLLYAI